MTIGEKIEKFVFDTNWSAVGKKIRKTIIYINDKLEEQKKAYEKRNKKDGNNGR